MKAISIRQPWANLILDGAKTIEFRNWRIASMYLPLRVLVHAGQKYDLRDDLVPITWWEAQYPFVQGAILGAVTIARIKEYPNYLILGEDCKENYTFTPSPCVKTYGWILKDPVKFNNPTKYKGRLRFFDTPFSESDFERAEQ
jgi:hypothetical protein